MQQNKALREVPPAFQLDNKNHCTLWLLNFHCRVHNSQLLVPILSHTNSVQSLLSHLL